MKNKSLKRKKIMCEKKPISKFTDEKPIRAVVCDELPSGLALVARDVYEELKRNGGKVRPING